MDTTMDIDTQLTIPTTRSEHDNNLDQNNDIDIDDNEIVSTATSTTTPVSSSSPVASNSSNNPSTTKKQQNDVIVTPYHPIRNRAAASETNATSTTTSQVEGGSGGPVVTPQLLSFYYQHLFPYHFLYDWLRYGSGVSSNVANGSNSNEANNNNNSTSNNTFYHREFSMTIQTFDQEEIYIRYQSYRTMLEFQQAIQKRNPIKIDIGAIYTHPPIQKQMIVPLSNFQPVQRELVFDIDLTDYDPIRNCGCSQAQICKICWKFMYMAIDWVTRTLRTDFDFHHIQWFYSGRRGIHCYVCDDTAKDLDDHARTAILNYMTIDTKAMLGSSTGSTNQETYKSSSSMSSLHPMILRAYEVLEPYFLRDVIVSKKDGGHGLLSTTTDTSSSSSKEDDDDSDTEQSPSKAKPNYMKILDQLPNFAAPIRDSLHEKWSKKRSTPKEKWYELKKHLSIFSKQLMDNLLSTSSSSSSNKRIKLDAGQLKIVKDQQHILQIFCIYIVLQYTYPRLDVHVSTKRNHLLKSPFCIHPKTGRICVPISSSQYTNFDPFIVPTISQIISEYYQSNNNNTTNHIANDDSDANNQNNNENDNILTNDAAGSSSTTYLQNDNSQQQQHHQKWMTTSLFPYYSAFQKEFLKPLLLSSSQQQQRQSEQSSMDF